MKKTSFSLLLVIALLSICCLHYSCKPKNYCNLPAPNSLTADVIDSTSVKLEWTQVTGAARYRITVKDITTNTTLPLLTTVGTDTVIGGLTPHHEFTTIVQGICSPDQPLAVSPNGVATCWATDGIIIEDVVVMREIGGSGMTECDSCSTSFTALADNSLLPLGNGANPRAIHKLRIVSPAGTNKFFKLAFDVSCPHEIKGYECSGGTISTSVVGNEIRFTESATNFFTIKVDYTGRVAFVKSCASCTIESTLCLGADFGTTWTEHCN
ncbi:MAG: hypothetical protein GC192_24645 [Bacteroidetes bacterium]|nr:hypothetical protein [Bacteroidota bacterium]